MTKKLFILCLPGKTEVWKSVNAALAPLADFTDGKSGKGFIVQLSNNLRAAILFDLSKRTQDRGVYRGS